MAYDQIIKIYDEDGIELKIVPIALNLDKNIYLLHIFEENYNIKKKYIRNELILIEEQILTSTFSDTVHFMEELFLFDVGNNQNKYFEISQYKNTKNLKLKIDNENSIFISKSEARSMYKIYNLAFVGYSMAIVLENEFKFTPQILTKLLHDNNMLLKFKK